MPPASGSSGGSGPRTYAPIAKRNFGDSRRREGDSVPAEAEEPEADPKPAQLIAQAGPRHKAGGREGGDAMTIAMIAVRSCAECHWQFPASGYRVCYHHNKPADVGVGCFNALRPHHPDDLFVINGIITGPITRAATCPAYYDRRVPEPRLRGAEEVTR